MGAQLNYAKMKELMLQNVSKSKNRTFIQYTKDLIKQYIRNPYGNINNIRNVSAFLARTSMIYKKILAYFAQMPLFYYNIIYKADFIKGIDQKKFMKSYMDIAARLQEIDMQKEFSPIISTALRDGIYYGYIYDGDGDGFFIQSLDPQYCKVSALTGDGQPIIAFNASYFDSGSNSEYVLGTDEGTEGIWADEFVQGYNQYKTQGRDYMWFELLPENTICLCVESDYEMPLPYFLPIFVSLLDLLDLEAILRSKTELENYALLVSQIPILQNTDEVDDFAISIELVNMVQEQLLETVPDLVGVAYSPMPLEVVRFNSNAAEDTDQLGTSMKNLMANSGISELVVSGGSSTNSTGLKQSIMNDESVALGLVKKIESWMNAYIKANYSEDWIFKFLPITYFSQETYITQMKDAASLGIPVAFEYAAGLGKTPMEIMSSTLMENALGIKDGLWKPLSSTYMQSSDEGGRPEEKELTDEGQATRDGEKNLKTKDKG